MNVLLTGIDGYVGWPTALHLSRRFPDVRIIGVDHFGRRRWVEACGSVSAVPIASMADRLEAARTYGYGNISFVEGDLVDRRFVDEVIGVYKPKVILHLAAQPSAPYSEINGERASYTQYNNQQATRNLLWSVYEQGLAREIHFIETTTTGVYGAPQFEIPEGFFEVEHKGERDRIPFPGMARSWYHMSKCNDINNLFLANQQWGITITDLRTAIVYGTETGETAQDERLATRFDFDYYFGVVLNRFCAMAVAGYPITVYGKGGQAKPYISLEDCVQSQANAIEREKLTGKYEVYNQVTGLESIRGLSLKIQREAKKQLGVDVEIQHVSNPRVEKEDHLMRIDNRKFLEVLGAPRCLIDDGIGQILNTLQHYRDTLLSYRDRFMT